MVQAAFQEVSNVPKVTPSSNSFCNASLVHAVVVEVNVLEELNVERESPERYRHSLLAAGVRVRRAADLATEAKFSNVLASWLLVLCIRIVVSGVE